MSATAAGIHELFARQVRARPTGVAVRAGTASLTYRELSDRAARLAHHLRACGVRRGTVVGVRVEPGPDRVVVLLAVLQAGGVYVSLDTDVAHRVRDCRVRVVVTTLPDIRELPDTGGIVCLDVDRPLIAQRSPIPPVVPVRPDEPAFVWYDGGPDGVLVAHRTIAHLAADVPLRVGDTMPLLSAATSPGAALELWAPLCRGAAVEATPSRRSVAAALSGATVAFLPADRFHELARGMAFDGLRMLFTCGTDLSGAIVERVVRARPALRLVHCYAPAGCAVPASWRLARPGVSSGLRCGQWAGGTRLRVLDESGRRVPRGGTGAVFVAGAGVALGYHNRPERNRDLFVPDPFLAVPGARMLRTGDHATVLPDGTMALRSRADIRVAHAA